MASRLPSGDHVTNFTTWCPPGACKLFKAPPDVASWTRTLPKSSADATRLPSAVQAIAVITLGCCPSLRNETSDSALQTATLFQRLFACAISRSSGDQAIALAQ